MESPGLDRRVRLERVPTIRHSSAPLPPAGSEATASPPRQRHRPTIPPASPVGSSPKRHGTSPAPSRPGCRSFNQSTAETLDLTRLPPPSARLPNPSDQAGPRQTANPDARSRRADHDQGRAPRPLSRLLAIGYPPGTPCHRPALALPDGAPDPAPPAWTRLPPPSPRIPIPSDQAGPRQIADPEARPPCKWAIADSESAWFDAGLVWG